MGNSSRPPVEPFDRNMDFLIATTTTKGHTVELATAADSLKLGPPVLVYNCVGRVCRVAAPGER